MNISGRWRNAHDALYKGHILAHEHVDQISCNKTPRNWFLAYMLQAYDTERPNSFDLPQCPKRGDPFRNARSALSVGHQLVSGIFHNDRTTALARDGERWTKVVATSVRRFRPKKHQRHAVLFIATNTGSILKVSKIRRTFCVVEIIEVEKGAVIKDLALVTPPQSKQASVGISLLVANQIRCTVLPATTPPPRLDPDSMNVRQIILSVTQIIM